VSPAMPAPAMTTGRAFVAAFIWIRVASDRFEIETAFGNGLRGLELGLVFVERGTIGADPLYLVTHVEKHMRVIVWRLGAHAHEFPHADLDRAISRAVVEMRYRISRHHCLPRGRLRLRLEHKGALCKCVISNCRKSVSGA